MVFFHLYEKLQYYEKHIDLASAVTWEESIPFPLFVASLLADKISASIVLFSCSPFTLTGMSICAGANLYTQGQYINERRLVYIP